MDSNPYKALNEDELQHLYLSANPNLLELKRKFSQNPANICSVLCLNVLNSMFSLRYYNFCFDSSEASFSGHFARTNVEHWD